jgi:hypothetical protein
MAGVGEGAGRVERGPGLEPVAQVLGQPVGLEMDQPGQLGDADGGGVIAPDAGHALGELDVGRAGLELAGGDPAQLPGHHVGGPHGRAAADHDRAAAPGAPAVGGQVGVALA